MKKHAKKLSLHRETLLSLNVPNLQVALGGAKTIDTVCSGCCTGVCTEACSGACSGAMPCSVGGTCSGCTPDCT